MPAKRTTKAGSSGEQHNTRVYAPTHRSGPVKGHTRGSEPTMQTRPVAPAPQPAPRGQAPISSQPKRQAQPLPQPKRQQAAQATGQARPKPAGTNEARRQAQGAKAPASNRRKGKKAPIKQEKQQTYSAIHRFEPVGVYRGEQQKSRNAQPKKMRKPMPPKRLLTIFIACVVGVGLLLAGYFVFLLDNIMVDGNDAFTDEQIAELSGLHIGRHMLLNDIAHAKTEIENNAYFNILSITREFPRTIRIQLQERREAAAILSQGYNAIIDITGHVLSISAGGEQNGLIQVAGMSHHGFQVNKPLGSQSDIQVQYLLSILKELDAFLLLQDVQELDLTNPLHITMTTKEGILVVLGEADNLDEKMGWLRDALPSLRMSGMTGGTLDVSAKGGAIYSPPLATTPAQPEGDVPEPGDNELDSNTPNAREPEGNTVDPDAV